MAFIEVRQEVVSVPGEMCEVLLRDNAAFEGEKDMLRLGELKIVTRPF
jgi:hypothetical protein